MERFKFLQAVHLRPDLKGSGRDFSKGTHAVPDELQGEDFLKYVSAGWIVEADAEPEKVTPKSKEEKAKALLAKLKKAPVVTTMTASEPDKKESEEKAPEPEKAQEAEKAPEAEAEPEEVKKDGKKKKSKG